MSFSLHPQLVADCHVLGHYQHCHVLLQRNAVVPWFIIVPETEETEFLLLDIALQIEVLFLAGQLWHFMSKQLAVEKTNMATIGNIVAQLHMHVIGRSKNDACWPLPVWGHLDEQKVYSDDSLSHFTQILYDEYGLMR